MEIRPNYYKDEDGHDLFWKMEHGMYDLACSIGFCHIKTGTTEFEQLDGAWIDDYEVEDD